MNVISLAARKSLHSFRWALYLSPLGIALAISGALFLILPGTGPGPSMSAHAMPIRAELATMPAEGWPAPATTAEPEELPPTF